MTLFPFYRSFLPARLRALYAVALACVVLFVAFAPSLSGQQQEADLILHNGRIYTVNGAFDLAEALAVREGRIVEVGTSKDILRRWKAKTSVNLRGKFAYPGFYDAHAHFYGYGKSLQEADLTGTRSFDEILKRLQAYRKANPQKRWIVGRGWDQNDWTVKNFPTKEPLDALFPDVPVCLTRVDGHALLANSRALELAGVSEASVVEGGLVEKVDGRLTGILVDNAMDKVTMKIPAPSEREIEEAILAAERRCFAVGLTSVAEAGISHELVETYKRLYAANRLSMRIYAMLTPSEENVERYLAAGPYQTERLTVRSFKVLADGALGSRGACLLEPYSDKPSTRGFLTVDSAWMESLVRRVSQSSFQLNTHCIGDSANRFVLDLYGKYLGQFGRTKRWRIEHAQVVTPEDRAKFRDFGVIPSVQPTHCTSDMPWAGARLGEARLKNAYAFQDLYEQRGVIALGSDFPVEDINPLYGFHAAISRQDALNKPSGGFQPEQRLARETALRGMTLYAAFAGFEEHLKGSLEVGKLADIVVLDADIMTAPPEKIRAIRTLYTISGGKIVYKR